MDGARPDQVAKRRLSRKERKDRTRQRLIDAAIDVVRQEGVEALTTTRLARAAGITQPAFYVHFKNVDHCLRVTSEQVFERLYRLQAESRRQAYSLIRNMEDLGREDIVAKTYNATLDIALSEPKFMELALRFRRDTSSPLGESMRRALDQARRDIAEDGWRAARRAGIPARFRDRYELFADFFMWLFLGAVEALLDGRYADRQMVVGMLTRATRSAILAEMKHFRAQASESDDE